MKNFSAIAALLLCGFLSAQQDAARAFKTGLSANFQHLDGEALVGPSVDLNSVWQLKKGPSLGYGVTAGVFFTRVDREQQQELQLDLLYQTFRVPYDVAVEGNLYLIPCEGYALIGHREDFLEIGAGLHYLQFDGTRAYLLANEVWTYEVQDFTILAGLQMGYLHRPTDRGAMFRVLWKPTWNLLNDSYANSYQVGVGYSF